MAEVTDAGWGFPSVPEGATPARYFRDVLGNFPTGVVVVTAPGREGEPLAMVVGSFSSVSLDPPMVMFLADRASSTFPKIRDAGHFTVNVLAADQVGLCRSMAGRGPDRFRGVTWSPSSTGAPVLDGIVARVDCTMDQVVEAGDHFLALGAVQDLRVVSSKLPLLFFRGEYGAFGPHASALPDWSLGWG
ncbi:flavin reductase family protein [Kineosporia mesophila]|uniref:Flavin reductase family protein n=1 Tax=Kineosporia mesophila TaxID=566012 RepID=A0ABP6ZQD8_9ACTN|nr:flavin reductase family protein [Kineosporia mesophila]MCD5354462.1 flavin reductase family protein [Kineosporia mesophila]